MANHPDVEQLRFAYEIFHDPIMVCAADGLPLFANQAFYSALSVSSDDLSSLSFASVFRPLSDEEERCKPEQCLQNGWKGKVAILLPKSPLRHCDLQISPLIIPAAEQTSPKPTLLVLRFCRDEEQRADALETIAYRDDLTGLANRALFHQILEREISQCHRENSRFALLFIDLDGFKQINDTHGHDAGDLLLCHVADRLQKSLRKSDTVARLGGDEFVVILHNIKEADTVATVAEKVVREVKKPLRSGPNLLEVGCSLGISIFPDNGAEKERLLQHADAAMYRAKHQGGNSYYYFSEALNRELEDTRKVELELKQGLQNREFVPYFQPLVDQRTAQVVGVECLTRWIHPERGVLNPIAFLPVAMKVGLMQEILEQVVSHAFAQLVSWQRDDLARVPLSINVSGRQFAQQQTFDVLTSLLQQFELPADAVRIEITESALQERGQQLVDQLQRISSAGFSIALDDFGTGYSSLRFLQQLPVDTLKIDRSFVRNLENNPQDKIIVKAIIQLAQTLGIEAIAEGVENRAQQTFLQNNACHVMQGFLFSPALPGDEFGAYLRRDSIELMA